MVNAEEISRRDFHLPIDQIIMGVPTWFDGELPNYWDEFVPALEDMDLTGKKIALYGLGDQKGYPENFLDGMGIMAEILEEQGATLVGFTSVLQVMNLKAPVQCGETSLPDWPSTMKIRVP